MTTSEVRRIRAVICRDCEKDPVGQPLVMLFTANSEWLQWIAGHQPDHDLWSYGMFSPATDVLDHVMLRSMVLARYDHAVRSGTVG